jgi:riboflavin transporter FmnP
MPLIPIFTFLILFILLSIRHPDDDPVDKDWRPAFLLASVVWGSYVAISSESLSLLSAIDRRAIALIWIPAFVLLLIYGLLKGRLIAAIKDILPNFPSFTRNQALIFGVACLFILILALVAWEAPPNTNDALQYHMSRVMHWIQDRSLAYYPTPINRQLWMPPWAEMAMLHLHLLAGSDRLVNFVEWFSMVGSLVGVSLIAKVLGASIGGQLAATVFGLTIPMGVLQASSAKNDYVSALWAVCLAYIALRSVQRKLRPGEWLTAILAVGLGVLTKGTFVVFALPFLVLLLISLVRQKDWSSLWRCSLIGLIAVLLFNAGVWGRNFQTYGNFLGPDASIASHVTQGISPAKFASNLILNSTLHLAIPFVESANQYMEQVVREIHAWLKVKLDPDYRILSLWRHEDYAGNPLHFLLALFFVAFLLAYRKETRLHITRFYALAVVVAYLLFSLIYPWQPFGSRLQLPLFVLFAPVAGMVISQWRLSWLRGMVYVLLFANGLLVLVFNQARPIIDWQSKSPGVFTQDRLHQLFANVDWAEYGYINAANTVIASGCREIGLKIDSHDPEYALWVLLSPTGRERRLEHIDMDPPLDRYLAPDFQPCAILCSYCSKDKQPRYGLIPTANFEGMVVFLPPGDLP